jgi:hypothetical protein
MSAFKKEKLRKMQECRDCQEKIVQIYGKL